MYFILNFNFGSENNVKVLGTSPVDVDRAENRKKFSKVLDDIKLDQPEWAELRTPEEALEFADRVRYISH